MCYVESTGRREAFTGRRLRSRGAALGQRIGWSAVLVRRNYNYEKRQKELKRKKKKEEKRQRRLERTNPESQHNPEASPEANESPAAAGETP